MPTVDTDENQNLKIKCYNCMTDIIRREMLEKLHTALVEWRKEINASFDPIDEILTEIQAHEDSK